MRSFPLWQPGTDAVAYADTSGGGKIIVILVMFMGRLGPVTLAIALRRRSGRKDVDIQRPEQRVLIG